MFINKPFTYLTGVKLSNILGISHNVKVVLM